MFLLELKPSLEESGTVVPLSVSVDIVVVEERTLEGGVLRMILCLINSPICFLLVGVLFGGVGGVGRRHVPLSF